MGTGQYATGSPVASAVSRATATRLVGLLLRSPQYKSATLRECPPLGGWVDAPAPAPAAEEPVAAPPAAG